MYLLSSSLLFVVYLTLFIHWCVKHIVCRGFLRSYWLSCLFGWKLWKKKNIFLMDIEEKVVSYRWKVVGRHISIRIQWEYVWRNLIGLSVQPTSYYFPLEFLARNRMRKSKQNERMKEKRKTEKRTSVKILVVRSCILCIHYWWY